MGAPMIRTLPDEIADQLADASPSADAATDEQVVAFFAEHQTASRPDVLNGLRSALVKNIEAGKSRHDSAVSAMAGAMKEARAGYYSAQYADDQLKPIFINAVQVGDNKRTPNRAADEWKSIVAWGVAQANAADLDEVRKRTEEKMPNKTEFVDQIGAAAAAAAPRDAVPPIPIEQARKVFRRWLGDEYDTDALDAMLAVAAVEKFNDFSDLIWLLLVSGPGNAKTETVQSLDGIGAVVTSAISSEAALLSATPKRERAKNATGGLLRKVGDRGVLVIKDVTSILSMNRDLRARVLAALREIYDGRWYREVGTDGGQTIPWEGRIAVIGAVTTAWDAAHAVISTMGDRFVLVRLDSTTKRQAAGRKAIGNTGEEQKMRAELAAAVAGVLAGMADAPTKITDDETDILLAAADLVTLARTGVEYDYRGEVIDAHAPEMPTRFAKQLAQIIRGAVALGMERNDALRLAIRCARDSMPPLRLAIIEDLADHPHSSTSEVRRRIDKPRNTVDRQLQALHILGVVGVDEQEYSNDGRSRWFYSLADGIKPEALDPESVPGMSLITHSTSKEREERAKEPDIGSDISGEPRRPGCLCADKPEPCHYCALASGRNDAA
jgi:hypothetical protein